MRTSMMMNTMMSMRTSTKMNMRTNTMMSMRIRRMTDTVIMRKIMNPRKIMKVVTMSEM